MPQKDVWILHFPARLALPDALLLQLPCRHLCWLLRLEQSPQGALVICKLLTPVPICRSTFLQLLSGKELPQGAFISN